MKHRPTPRQHTVIELCCEQGLTYEQVARAMGVGRACVGQQIHDLLRRLGVRNMNQVCMKHGRATMVRDMKGGAYD